MTSCQPRQVKPENMIAKCECEHCGTPIEFSTDEFLSGSQQACPACGGQMTLCVAKPSKPRAPLPKEPVKTFESAASLPARIQAPALVENELDGIGALYFAIGLVGAVCLGIAAIGCFAEEKIALAVSFAIAAAVSAAQGWIIKTVFRALAEIIRLLRRQAEKTKN